MKFTAKSVAIGALLSLVFVFAFVPQLFAREGESGGTTTTPSTPPAPTMQEHSDTMDMNHESQSGAPDDTAEVDSTAKREDNPAGELRKEVSRERLDSRKKALCESGQTLVNKAIGNVSERSTNQFERITAIYDMSVKFYAVNGLSISIYDTLVKNVDFAKAAAMTANQSLVTTQKLSCDSDGPKADMQAFRNKRLDKVSAFGAYRDAVKTLVKAVRVAAKGIEVTGTTPPTSNDTKLETTAGGTN